jgi:hypothetical protein
MWKLLGIYVLGNIIIAGAIVALSVAILPKEQQTPPQLLPISIPENIIINKEKWTIDTHGASFRYNGTTSCEDRVINIYPENIKISNRFNGDNDLRSRIRKTLLHELEHAMSCGWADSELYDITKYNSTDGTDYGHDGADRLAVDLYDLFSHNRDLKIAMFGN